MGVVEMYVNDSEVKTLIELTEHFLEFFLDLLYQQGNITATQFSEMTEKKVRIYR